MTNHPSLQFVGHRVCALSEIPDGGGRMFVVQHSRQGELPLLVLRSGDRCFGYVNRCPHFDIPLAAQDAQLLLTPHIEVKCNTHYARFRWQDGYCLSGDCAGETLPPVALYLEAGDVYCA